MKKSFIAGLLMLTAGSVNASSITVDFPSGASITTASADQFFFNPSHTVNETFAGTGIVAATALDLDLNLDHNNLRDGGFVNFDVLLNSVDVGDISFNEFDAFGLYSFSFNFAAIVGAGTYNIALAVANTVPGGDGSVGFSERLNTATISNVPEPATLGLLGLGLAGLGFARRKAA